MKATVACVVLSLAAVGVLGGSFYGEKENAIKAVNDKYKGLATVVQNVRKHVADQRGKKELETEEQVQKEVIDEANKAVLELSDEALNVTESGLAKGKPLSLIECVVNAIFEGLYSLMDAMDGVMISVQKIKERKDTSLTTMEVELNLVEAVSTIVKDKTLKMINNATSGFQVLQADAVKKMDSAKKQLDELDPKILKIDIKSEFLALKRQVGPKLKESIAASLKKIKQCL